MLRLQPDLRHSAPVDPNFNRSTARTCQQTHAQRNRMEHFSQSHFRKTTGRQTETAGRAVTQFAPHLHPLNRRHARSRLPRLHGLGFHRIGTDVTTGLALFAECLQFGQ